MLTFNESALNNLLQSPDGPVGRKLDWVSQTIKGNYEEAVAEVWQHQPASARPDIGYDITNGDFGLQSVIGFLNTHGETRLSKSGRSVKTTSAYMAEKFQYTERDKFAPRIMAGWDNAL